MNRLLPFLGAAFLAGCSLTPKIDPEWVSDEFPATSERVLWQVTRMTLEKEGFPVGAGLDPSTVIATSGWRLDLAPFRGQGFREQAQVRFERLEPGRYKVEVRVRHEINQDIVRPLDPQYAEWEPAPDRTDRAHVLLQRIKSWMGTELEFEP
jgi:hypothetical protein